MSNFVEDILAQLDKKPSDTQVSVQAPTTLAVPDLALPLLDYQREAVEFALSQRMAYLGLDMGLGKTACAIAIAVAVSATKPGRPVLAVVPPSLRTNWVREFHKFAPTATVSLISGKKPHALPNVDVIVCGDSTLEAWAPVLVGGVSAIIVDEAHRTKNKEARRTKAIKSIAGSLPPHSVRVLMSGTPAPNGRATELVTVFDILDQWKVVGGKGEFYRYFAPPAKNGYGREHIEERFTELGERIRSTFMYRRLRDEVLSLPNKGRSTVALDCGGHHATRYKKAEQDIYSFFREENRSTSGLDKAQALVLLNTLRKLSGEAKIPALIALIKEMFEDDKSGIFVVAEHSAVIDALQVAFLGKCVTIRGGMSDNDKTEAVDAFNSGRIPLLIGQITASGVGLTLHGDGRNHRVVFAQIPWTPAELRQAEDRLHRIGQTKDVHVTVCLSAIEGAWTIDERLWMLLDSKAFSASAIENGKAETLTDRSVLEGILETYR